MLINMRPKVPLPSAMQPTDIQEHTLHLPHCPQHISRLTGQSAICPVNPHE